MQNSNLSFSDFVNYDIIEENKHLIEDNYNIKFDDKTLRKLNTELLTDNVQQLDYLLKKYPKMQEYIENKQVILTAENFKNKTTVACFSYDVEHKSLDFKLSKKKFINYDNFIKKQKENIEKYYCMPCADNKVSVYSITHEYGHFIENMLISEYNELNPTEYANMLKKLEKAKTSIQENTIFLNWEKSIADTIQDEILEIAKEKSTFFNPMTYLSTYGNTNSFEFFAECFANMECGKSNILGEAMKEFLKRRNLL